MPPHAFKSKLDKEKGGDGIYRLYLSYGESLGWRETKWKDIMEEIKEVDDACR